MARLLRLHLANVGHAKARFSPLPLDFRALDRSPADTVIWLRNGGGKSSLLNLFYATLLPETARFLGRKTDGQSRRLGDYVQARDLSFIVTEWALPGGSQLFPATRIVGQVLAWKDGIAAPHDESRLERLFFTFRTSERVPFSSLPISGISESPVVSMALFREWLEKLKTEHREVEVEHRNERQKGEWRRVLHAVGIDAELFQYQLTMNAREGGAAELFRVRDVQEFIELFLEMAYPPTLADETAKTLTGVREKLRKLPERELEEKFVLAVLAQLRPLADAGANLRKADEALTEKRRANYLLRAAVEHSLVSLGTAMAVADGERIDLESKHSGKKQEKLRLQEYRLNYEYLALEFAWQEAEATLQVMSDEKAAAERNYKLALAAVAWAEVAAQDAKLKELKAARDAQFAEQKPEVEKLEVAGSIFAASLDEMLNEGTRGLETMRASLQASLDEQSETDKLLKTLIGQLAGAEKDFDSVCKQLQVRDVRRGQLLAAQLLQKEEKAAAAILRWQAESETRAANAATHEGRAEELRQAALNLAAERETAVASRDDFARRAKTLGDAVNRGDSIADTLRANEHIREVLPSEKPDLDFPSLSKLLHERERLLLNRLIAARLDEADDQRASKAVEGDQLLPPARDVELVVAHLRAQGVRTAIAAYRFLANNKREIVAAERLLAHDPARYSGVFVQSTEDLARVSSIPLRVPGLRHPVAVTLSDLPTDEAAPVHTIVALPESAGAFHFGAAADAQRGIQQRLEDSLRAIESLNATREEAAAVTRNLADFLKEFGAGKLAALRSEATQCSEEEIRWKGKAETLRGVEAEQREAATQAQNDALSLRKSLPKLASDIQRLQNYYDQCEKREEGWTQEREQLQKDVEQLSRDQTDAQTMLNDLAPKIETARSVVTEAQETVKRLNEERENIRYRSAQPAPEVLSLAGARTRYQSLVDAFDKRFGGSRIEGQIDEAQQERNRRQLKLVSVAGDLPTDEISSFAALPDFSGRASEAESDRLNAHSRHENARTERDRAHTQRKPRAHKQGEGLPPGIDRPTSATEAWCRHAEINESLTAIEVELEAAMAALNAKKDELGTLKTSHAAREPLLTNLEGVVDPSTGPMPSLPEDDAALGEMVTTAKRDADQLATDQRKAAKVVHDGVEALGKVCRADEFHALPLTLRERLPNFPQPELLLRCDELVRGHEERQRVLRDEIETFARDKDLVVRALDQVATGALNLLHQAERASTMPDTLPGWASQAFLRIRTSPIEEPSARRERLGQLVDRLVAEQVIPHGHALASATVREIGGQIRATLLKPEDVLRPERHDILDFGNFSGGERLTAAILLYATLAQLRARARDGSPRARAAGVLILDNPFGTASKREFVHLQLLVAQQMGVQLVYATGVNDLGALDVLPRILRLRNAHRDRRTGDLLVTEEIEPSLESIAANLRP